MAESFRVLLSDSLSPQGTDILKHHPQISVDIKTGLRPLELAGIIGSYDALVVRSATKVTREVIDRANALKIIGRAGVGVDNVDIDAATRRGIVVMNSPLGNSVTRAEHTISMMMALARHIPAANAALRAGRWEREKFTGSEVCNKTLGIIGLGNIGRIVADRALGLKMKVIGFDPIWTAEEGQGAGAVDIANQVVEFVLEGMVRHAVNLPALSVKELETLGPDLSLGVKLGRLAGQLIDEAPTHVTVGFAGEAANLQPEPITAAVLKGLLSGFLDQELNYVNAPYIARERGITMVETRSREPADYINTLTITVRTASGSHEVTGAVFGNRALRLIRIDGYPIEAAPEGYFLMLHNRDVPGVVSAGGTRLAPAGG